MGPAHTPHASSPWSPRLHTSNGGAGLKKIESAQTVAWKVSLIWKPSVLIYASDAAGARLDLRAVLAARVLAARRFTTREPQQSCDRHAVGQPGSYPTAPCSICTAMAAGT